MQNRKTIKSAVFVRQATVMSREFAASHSNCSKRQHDASFGDVRLQCADGRQFQTSRSLWAGVSNVVKVFFEQSPEATVYNVPDQIDSSGMDILTTWLHGPPDMKLPMHLDQAIAALRAADLLAVECFIDNFPRQIYADNDSLKLMQLADELKVRKILVQSLSSILPQSSISAADVCDVITDKFMMLEVLKFFDSGFLTMTERVCIVTRKWGCIPDELGNDCAVPLVCKMEALYLSKLIDKKNLKLPSSFSSKAFMYTYALRSGNFPMRIVKRSVNITTSAGVICVLDQGPLGISMEFPRCEFVWVHIRYFEMTGSDREESLGIHAKTFSSWSTAAKVQVPQNCDILISLFDQYGRDLSDLQPALQCASSDI